jgi:hypothetical protein
MTFFGNITFRISFANRKNYKISAFFTVCQDVSDASPEVVSPAPSDLPKAVETGQNNSDSHA